MTWQAKAMLWEGSQIAKFMGPTWDPPGSCRPQIGPMLAPWTLLSGIVWEYETDKITGYYKPNQLLAPKCRIAKCNNMPCVSNIKVTFLIWNAGCLSTIVHHFELLPPHQQACISPEPGAKANRQWGGVGWMVVDHIGTGYWDQFFLAWSSIAQSVCQQSFILLEIRFQRTRVRIQHIAKELVSFRFANRLPVPEHRN